MRRETVASSRHTQTQSPVLHRKQFILGPRPVPVRPDWRCCEIAEGLFLSTCPDLPVLKASDREGTQWVVLGVAVQSDPEGEEPRREIVESSGEEVLRASDRWAGRWVLVGGGRLFLDGCGLLGCYVREDPSCLRPWVSSSCALLTDGTVVPPVPASERFIVPGVGFDYDPPPLTRFEGVRKLLPTQVCDLFSGSVESRPLLAHGAVPEGYEKILDALGRTLRTTLCNFARGSSRLFLPLTGGYDSRLLLAVAVSAGVPLTAFTQLYSDMARLDRILPPKLARAAGVPFRYVAPGPLQESRLVLFDRHTAGCTFEADRRFYACGQWDWARPGDWVLRGLCFETGRAAQYRRFAKSWAVRGRPDPFMVAESQGEGVGSLVHRSLCQSFDWFAANPTPQVDWRDRFHLEVRLAGWASALEQGTDLVSATVCHPANSRLFYKLLLALPEKVRLTTQHHVDLISKLCPELSRYPYEGRRSVFGRGLRCMLHTFSLLRRQGFRAAFRKVSLVLRQR